MTVRQRIVSATPFQPKLTIRDFEALNDAGAFEEYVRTELIEGEIWVVNAIHRRHAQAQASFTGELHTALKAMGSDLVLFSNPSTELSDDSLSEPDVAVAEAGTYKYVTGPTTRLAVEISDSSLDFDMKRKARLYARYAIPEYWVVDVAAGVVHQHWAPIDEAYVERREVPLGEAIDSMTIAGLRVATVRV